MSSLTLDIGTFIGTGGYGSVFHARWGKRPVAVKQFHVTQDEAQHMAAVQQEIQMLDTLRDRHIIQFYGTHYHKGMLVLIMDYAEGGSLAKAIDCGQLGHDDWPTKMRLAQEMARGLYYIHQNNVVHRDLKSANVLLTKHMEVKLCDFGLAMIKIKSSSKSLAASPNNSEVRSLVKEGEREELPESTPAVYRQWVERCWEHDPAKRPDAGEMAEDDDILGMVSMVHNPDPSVSLSESMTSKLTISSPSSTTASVPSTVTLESAAGSGESKRTPSSFPSSWPSAGQTPAERARALAVLIDDAKNNNVTAQVELAGLYAKGNWVVKDEGESFHWYMRAARKGHAAAQFTVGELLMSGHGTPANRTVAAVWYRRAAEQDHADAQSKLGSMGQKDFTEALSLYLKSAEQGNADAQCGLGKIYMKRLGVGLDYSKAFMWFRKAADQGNADAQCVLGAMYMDGSGVDQEYSEALTWLHKSADQGNADAQIRIGKVLFWRHTDMALLKTFRKL
ncbi:hypothetical protein DFQ26_009649 [Actinomortierella ambigua]|nr:hypothetical protein DFQ26_009649 [Actinomortierella ambigua]